MYASALHCFGLLLLDPMLETEASAEPPPSDGHAPALRVVGSAGPKLGLVPADPASSGKPEIQ